MGSPALNSVYSSDVAMYICPELLTIPIFWEVRVRREKGLGRRVEW